MPNVELGFLEHCEESWKLESPLFPSKVGGKPAWLSLKPLPNGEEDLTCNKCQKTLIFLCQLYAPYEPETTDPENLDNNFHRTIFVFVCRTSSCQTVKVLRSSLPRDNDFYSSEPPVEKPDPDFLTKWVEVCNSCGIKANKRCGQCKMVWYCCKDHQLIHWRNGHKNQCSKGQTQLKTDAGILFPEWELITETEERETEDVDEREAMAEYEKLKAEGKTGTLEEVSESDLDAHASLDMDKVFAKFKKRIEDYPDQVIRYSRGGEPLLIAKEPLPLNIPKCKHCGTKRQFEFQIMPQMLSVLKENIIDWGVLLIYTCKKSCIGESINEYKEEYVFRQDLTSDSDHIK
ncbi:unnamed protein product [Ceutorhynchus assimilis]|uniref:MYND-type domain-containing protein n=1 Tax=Ceutorhynchus assimilis TaxID=467358 RepID=A0A9N9QIX9_9CUCU|nr:unnamed protein product [Ceutorhynchus assimilis]